MTKITMKNFFLSLISATVLLSGSGAAAHGGHEHHDENGQHQHNKLCPVFFALADVCAQVQFTQGPVSDDESQFTVSFYKHTSAHGEHVMVDPQDVKVDLWMNMGGHGHGSAPVKIVKQSTGVYFVSEAYFVMPGTWSIRFAVDNEQAEFSVDVP